MIQGTHGKAREQKEEKQISVLLFIQIKWNNLATNITTVSEQHIEMAMVDFLTAWRKLLKTQHMLLWRQN